ncbi:hypothetical protein [Paraburkholderia sp. MM5482-R1]|uniref:hypothetical protein n=1 Tax=unclassified Paraburkholderia TaxID=2615204 RepID=UPI003D1D9108
MDRFRRYQHLLMFGGGAVVTAVVLVAFVLNTVATVRTYVALEHQELMSGVNRLTDLNSRNVVLMQNGVRLIEVAWRAGEQAEPRLVEQFTGNGQMLRLQQAPDHLPVLVVGASSATPPDLLATRYIRLAKQISQAATAASERNGGLLTFWLYRPERPLLILVPSPGDARMATLLADRAVFFLHSRDLAAISLFRETCPCSIPAPGGVHFGGSLPTIVR